MFNKSVNVLCWYKWHPTELVILSECLNCVISQGHCVISEGGLLPPMLVL